VNNPDLSPRRISLSIDVGHDVNRRHLAGIVLDDVLSRLSCEQVHVHSVSLEIAGPLTTT
jgi:hypothetical protein